MRGGERERAEALGREALAYADGLYNLARYLTRNHSDAEDLVQETYGRAIKASAQFTPGTNLKAWLFRILRNAFISHYRRDRHNPVTVGGLDTVTPRLPGRDGYRLASARQRRDRPAAKGGRRGHRARAPELSEDARTVILLDLEGLTESESAEVLGCAVGTVKSRLSRARASLRALLRDWEP